MPSKLIHLEHNLVLQHYSLFFEHLKQTSTLRYVKSSGLFLSTAVARKECRREALFWRRTAAKIETLGLAQFV